MTEERLNKIHGYFRTHDKAFFFLRIIYKYLPILIYLLYPLLLLNTFYCMVKFGNVEDFINTLVIPAVTFLSVTALRILINKPRPYEAMDITPLFPKDTVGKSFPSRHSASIFSIAMASFTFSTAVGVTLLIIGVIMCASRVIAGVHYISDVTAGAVFAILLALLGLLI
jgi:membrane-associated phospholipid phosphatase